MLLRVAAMASCHVPGSVDGRLRDSDGGLRARPGYAPQRHDSFNRLQSCGLAARWIRAIAFKGGWQIESDNQANWATVQCSIAPLRTRVWLGHDEASTFTLAVTVTRGGSA
jgi:hypothetical protein